MIEPGENRALTSGDVPVVPELHGAEAIRRAELAARRAGGITNPIEVLSDSALDLPLDDPDFPAEEWPTVPVAAHPLTPAGYEIHEEIGRGGQACVYRATQESTGRPVAVKIMSGASLANSRHRARFDREARILAKLHHPFIVSIVDRCRTGDGSFCLVMECIDGRELDDFWSNCIPGTEAGTRRMLELFVKVCRAIGEAHDRGVVHRDLKPSNIRVDLRGDPHILDFGLARGIDAASRELTLSGQLVGSVPWSSPEQAGGGEDAIDGRSDVYSIGVMLYQALTGRFPYPIDGPFREVLNNIANAIPRPPSQEPLSRKLGRNLDAVVLKALAKRPQDRYASANALADDLDRVLEGRRVSAVHPRPLWVYWSVAVAAGVLLAASSVLMLARPSFTPQTIPHFELPAISNSVGMRLVRVPIGGIMMGSPASEPGHLSPEPERLVTIREPLYIATTEVTQQQYESVMGSNPSDQRWRAADLPVQNVSWNDAREFCRRLSEREHRTYRLPTEAEWEYACRGGIRGPFSGARIADPVAWDADNSGGQTHPVAGKEANAWGIYDMHGNVAEWCADVFEPNGTPPPGPQLQTVKGGSVLDPAARCRSASHWGLPPNTRRSDLGFRVVLESIQPTSEQNSTSSTPTSRPH